MNMKVTEPKWVKKANQWCVTTVENTSGKGTKHDTRQTQYWFSTEEEAKAKVKELSAQANESKNN